MLDYRRPVKTCVPKIWTWSGLGPGLPLWDIRDAVVSDIYPVMQEWQGTCSAASGNLNSSPWLAPNQRLVQAHLG